MPVEVVNLQLVSTVTEADDKVSEHLINYHREVGLNLDGEDFCEVIGDVRPDDRNYIMVYINFSTYI